MNICVCVRVYIYIYIYTHACTCNISPARPYGNISISPAAAVLNYGRPSDSYTYIMLYYIMLCQVMLY